MIAFNLSPIQEQACRTAILNSEEGRRDRALDLGHKPIELELHRTENEILHVSFKYEKVFNLKKILVEYGEYEVYIMPDGITTCSCDDSINRRVACKHALCVCILALTEKREGTKDGNEATKG